jgi:hypothetical protein
MKNIESLRKIEITETSKFVDIIKGHSALEMSHFLILKNVLFLVPCFQKSYSLAIIDELSFILFLFGSLYYYRVLVFCMEVKILLPLNFITIMTHYCIFITTTHVWPFKELEKYWFLRHNVHSKLPTVGPHWMEVFFFHLESLYNRLCKSIAQTRCLLLSDKMYIYIGVVL